MGGNLSKQPAYRNENLTISGELTNTDDLFHKGFFIGCHPFVTEKNISTIESSFDNFFKNLENA